MNFWNIYNKLPDFLQALIAALLAFFLNVSVAVILVFFATVDIDRSEKDIKNEERSVLGIKTKRSSRYIDFVKDIFYFTEDIVKTTLGK